jgi:riboflavin kinase / FMN adenylyltransferase
MDLSISGKVVKGIQKGAEIGYPTINIQLIDAPKDIEFGIYTCTISIEGSDYNAVMHYGNKSIGTDDAKKIFCEVHVFDFAEDVYGKEVYVNLLKKIRDVRQFDSEEDLVEQIESDILSANKYFQNHA